MSSCTNAVLAEQLLRCSEAEVAQRTELADHVRTCAACQSLVEQRRRLAAHWDSRELTQSELLRLRARLFRSAKEPAGSQRSRVAVGALAIALFAAAAAATYATTVFQNPSPRADAPRPLTASAPPRASTSPGPNVNPSPLVSTEPEAIVAPAPAPARSASVNARPKPADANADPRWVTVTEALQRHDRQAAEQALAALSRTGDARSRDAARLTLAELWLQSGRAAQAKPVLHDLAAHGSTATVRARATTLLEPLGG